jgi:hypothetical protein
VSGKQNLVAAGGLGLIAANFWLGGARQTVSAGLTKGAAPGTATNAHTEIKRVALELLFVGVAVVIAGASDGAASAMLAVIVALFVLWAINHYAPGQA